jgi:hypothetical protein
MSPSITEEFVIYQGRRDVGARSGQLWDQSRRQQYLIRLDVALPVSLDRRVLPEAVDWDVAVLDLMAAVVPANAPAAAIDALRGWELFDQALPLEPEWERLGYDICDATGTSSLSNCGYEPGEREALTTFALQLNEHHLFREVEHADEFRAASDLRVPEHAPFVVIGIYAKRERVGTG